MVHRACGLAVSPFSPARRRGAPRRCGCVLPRYWRAASCPAWRRARRRGRGRRHLV